MTLWNIDPITEHGYKISINMNLMYSHYVDLLRWPLFRCHTLWYIIVHYCTKTINWHLLELTFIFGCNHAAIKFVTSQNIIDCVNLLHNHQFFWNDLASIYSYIHFLFIFHVNLLVLYRMRWMKQIYIANLIIFKNSWLQTV